MRICRSVQRAIQYKQRASPESRQSKRQRKKKSIRSSQSVVHTQRPAAVFSASKFGVPKPVTYKTVHQSHHTKHSKRQRTHRIPTGRSREAISIAPGVRTGRNVVQRTCGRAIQPRVQEPERALTRRRELVVQQRDDAREDGARTRRAIDAGRLAVDDDLELDALRRDVGVRAPRGVEEALVRVAERLQVRVHGVLLVGRCPEVVREPAGREVGGGLGADALRRAH